MVLVAGFVDFLRFILGWKSTVRREAFVCAHVGDVACIGAVAGDSTQSALAYNGDVATIGATAADRAC